MRNYFIFDGHDSRDYGVYISGSESFDAPGRSYEPVEVPGRDGDLLGLNNRFNNVEVTYPAFIYSNLRTNLAAIKGVLLGTQGYARLTDTYHPDEYRLAYFPGDLDVDMTSKLDAASFDISFMAKPQRYLTSGEVETEYTSGFTITNPTAFASRPLLHVVGNGTITIGTQEIEISSAVSEVYIDCDLMDCYDEDMSLNSFVTFSGNDFPVLKPGVNTVTLDSTITSIGVTPRWWRV